MTILLRNRQTKLYLSAREEWTSDRCQALAFGTGGAAIQYCLEKGLRQVEIILSFGDPRYDVALPVVPPAIPPDPDRSAGGA